MGGVQTKPIDPRQAGKAIAEAGGLDAATRLAGQARQTNRIWSASRSDRRHREQTKPISPSSRGQHGVNRAKQSQFVAVPVGMRPGERGPGPVVQTNPIWSAGRSDGCQCEQTKPISPGSRGRSGINCAKRSQFVAVPGRMRPGGRGPGPVVQTNPIWSASRSNGCQREQTSPISPGSRGRCGINCAKRSQSGRWRSQGKGLVSERPVEYDCL
jgi:hypothetical protein